VSPTDTEATPYRAAIDARDPAALAEACTPDVVFNSPITSSVRFEGREELAELFRSVLEVYDDLRCMDELGNGDEMRVLHLRARIGPQELEEVQLLRLDGRGQVREIAMFVRPLPGLTALAAALGPRLARRHSRWRAVLVAALSRPLAAATRIGERTGARLVKP
jgi:SnoaL-like domain